MGLPGQERKESGACSPPCEFNTLHDVEARSVCCYSEMLGRTDGRPGWRRQHICVQDLTTVCLVAREIQAESYLDTITPYLFYEHTIVEANIVPGRGLFLGTAAGAPLLSPRRSIHELLLSGGNTLWGIYESRASCTLESFEFEAGLSKCMYIEELRVWGRSQSAGSVQKNES